MSTNHLGFTVRRSQLKDRILIPKFYDPDIERSIKVACETFDLPLLSDLLAPGPEGSRLGQWLPREHYGTGNIPFVRTSDLSHWRIRTDYKKGVSQSVYEHVATKQDVRENDILMVAHGTYLVGDVALVTAGDIPMLLQDHVFRLRVAESPACDPYLLLAALSTRFVKRQVRSRQFSADIIDKIGERHLGLHVPLPREQAVREALSARVRAAIDEQNAIRAEVESITGAASGITGLRAESRFGFPVKKSQLVNRILIPRYHDPTLQEALAAEEAQSGHPWVTIESLIEAGLIDMCLGIQVGKIFYGTGKIPFVRTSDFVDWELRRGVRQGVSQAVYDEHKRRGSLSAGDVLVVSDGTYLVGSSAIVMPEDLPALFSNGMTRLRILDKERINPYSLLAALNLPLVRQQMRARQFSRNIIDTISGRIHEVRIPDPQVKSQTANEQRVEKVMVRKAALKVEIQAIIDAVEPPAIPDAGGRPGWSMR